MLDQLGIAKDRFQIVVNRTNKRFDLGNAEIEKLFSWKVHSRIPNDFASINRANSYGEPVDSKSDIGRAIEGLASRLSGPVIAPSLRSSNPDSLRLLAQVG
jgi:Flp pilus assembly CpaE family ATPase